MKKIIILLALSCLLFSANKTKAQTSNYVIVTTISDTTDAWFQPVRALRDYRNAQVVTFNANNIYGLLAPLVGLSPRYVAIVIKPTELYINFVRQFLMMSTQLDSDPFSDFAYGYITGATAQDALDFVNRIIYADTHNIKDYPLRIGGYAASSLNYVFPGANAYMAYLNPPSANSIYLETNDTNTGHDFFMANTSYMMNNKILDIGYNGDPHMLWLFTGGNSNPNPPVWNYDSTKIENPAYARAGLTSYDMATLNLYPAVAFNGACHSGETKKVMVEGDIAATFGDTQGLTEFYTMSDTFSFALSMLKTGITGYFAPCGANNANDQGEDVYNAFLYHEPLGDIQKRSNDGVVMGFLGNAPNLEIYAQGGVGFGCDVLSSGSFNPDDWSGACYMLGGKANRIYFGDPLFNPYQNNYSDSLNITKTTLDSLNPNTLDIHLTFNKPDGFWPVWDKFHYSNTRIYTPVLLPSYCGSLTNFSVIDSSGPYNLVVHVEEHFDGKHYLHIEVDIPNDMYGAVNYNMTFRIKFLLAGIENSQQTSSLIEVFPNPSKNNTNFSFPNIENKTLSMTIYDIKGEIVRKITEIHGNTLQLDNSAMKSGMYFFQLQSNENIVGKGKFIIEE
ncbi:MAG: T9SS type A sorting domain-containing protein [Bacteroidota bacterium]